MLLRPDQQKVHKMLTEAIMMLCRNGLDFSQEFAVEGLLGITLDQKEVFLVNIKENVNMSTGQLDSQSQIVDSATKQPSQQNDPRHVQATHESRETTVTEQPLSTSADVHPHKPLTRQDGQVFRARNSPHEHSPLGYGDQNCHGNQQEGIMSGPITPMMQQFKSPFRRQRGRRKFWGFGADCPRGMRRRFPHHRIGMMHAMMEAHKHFGTDHMSTFGMPFAKRQHVDDQTQPFSATTTASHSATSDQTEETNQADTQAEPKVKVEPANNSYPTEVERELTVDDSTSLHFSADQGFDEFGGSSPSTGRGSSWSFQDDNFQQPLTPSSCGTEETLSENFDDGLGTEMEPSLIMRVKKALLIEDGCFVTTRTLCRRYSSYFKSQIVVEAMKALTVPIDDPQHIGVFRNLRERSKVFFKCPPKQIRPEVLAAFNITPQKYEETYYKSPKPIGMHSPRWEMFVQDVLANSPYGTMNMNDFKVPQEEIPEVQPGSSMDEFDLQEQIVHSDGCFISSRILCRRLTKQYRVANVIRAMKAMCRPRTDKYHIGQFVKASERIKIFFKCPPRLLGSEALSLYGLTMEQYKRSYYKSPRPWDGSVSNWDSYLENIAASFPYSLEDFPLDVCDVSPDVADRIRNMTGVPDTARSYQRLMPADAADGTSMYGSSAATFDKFCHMLASSKSTEHSDKSREANVNAPESSGISQPPEDTDQAHDEPDQSEPM